MKGAVFMCAFTTKTAVYVLARGFPGFEILAIMGTAMTVYGVCYAVIENDMRRVLAYHIISQVGYMVAGVGIGTEMAVNGACGPRLCPHPLQGAPLHGGRRGAGDDGHGEAQPLGGLYKYMPLTMIFYVVGGVSISGFPLFSGFVSKSMIVAAAHHEGQDLAHAAPEPGRDRYLPLRGAEGHLLHLLRQGDGGAAATAKEPPWNMLWAMGLTSLLCFFIGVFPRLCTCSCPFPVDYHPYTAYHLSEMIQILAFTGLVFYLLVKKLTPEAKINLDVDWFYRKGTHLFLKFDEKVIAPFDTFWGELYRTLGLRALFKNAELSSVFDRKAIDGVVDGTAYSRRWISARS